MASSEPTFEMKRAEEFAVEIGFRPAAHSSGDQGVAESAPETDQVKTGVAFSGGGIRSAALCSGVLRRLLQMKVEPDYLSCVSGGGYTGTAYLDWKYRNGKKDDDDWHKQFFNHMRSRAGYICNWQEPCCGLWDTFMLLVLFLCVCLCVPIIGWGSFACPVAFIIDYAFGDVMKAPRYHCNGTTTGICQFPYGSKPYDRMLLFVFPLGLFVLSHLFPHCTKKCKGPKCEGLVSLFQSLSGSVFAFTFLPWFIHDYLDHTHYWVQIGVPVVSAVVWFFLPVLRRYSSLVILVYAISYVVYWRVYDKSLLGIQHTDELWRYFLYVSGLILGIASLTGDFQLRLMHSYNRWRLQQAFYNKESLNGICGCSGICCYDCFPGSHLCGPPPKQEDATTDASALSLHHLKDIKPQYISNIVANGWREGKDSKLKCRLLTMTPKEIEVIDCQPETTFPDKRGYEPLRDDTFENKLGPGDIKLSSAMAMSAAAVSPHLGAFEQEEQAITHLLTFLGIEMAATIVYDMALYFFIKGILSLPLIVCPIFYFCNVSGDSKWVTLGVGVPFIVMVLLCIPFMLCNTGLSDRGCFSRCSRWLIVHVPFCRFMRSIFNVINTGPVPPAMLHLSDGGHFENLAILPLLKRRLGKILIVNGGYIESDSCYGNKLVEALKLAREMLNCSFTAMDGDDVLADIKEKFVKKLDKPRKYEFKVHYEKTSGESERREVEEGHLVLISPRHPSKGLTRENETWKDLDQDLESGLWGPGPVLNSTDVDPLTFCCCECCHSQCYLSWVSKLFCGVFPHHATPNQFFTPAMFSAYHREGYRACMEADNFFGEQPDRVDREMQAGAE